MPDRSAATGGRGSPFFARTRLRCSAAVALLVVATAAHAQDALRGKRLYLDAESLVGTPVSCVDCHGGLPGGAFGIARAANDAAAIARAIETIPQMAVFRGRLGEADLADLAAYIGRPDVPSPDLRVTISGAAAAAPSRLDFGRVPVDRRSAIGTVNLINAGAVPMRLLGAPRVEGTDAAWFDLLRSDCAEGMPLAAQQGCRIDLQLRALPRPARVQARLLIPHDWIGAPLAVSLLAEVAAAEGVAGSSTGSGGGSAHALALLVGAGLFLRRRRSRPGYIVS